MEGEQGRLPVGTTKRPRRVFVVDDYPDSAQWLVKLLRALGHHATSVTNPLEATFAAAVFKPDIAFIDLEMPGLDGYALARLFRAASDLRHVHLVAVTGHGEPEDRARARGAGFDAHIIKPIDQPLLESILAQFDGQ